MLHCFTAGTAVAKWLSTKWWIETLILRVGSGYLILERRGKHENHGHLGPRSFGGDVTFDESVTNGLKPPNSLANYRHQVGVLRCDSVIVNTRILRCRVLGYYVVVMKFAASIVSLIAGGFCRNLFWLTQEIIWEKHRVRRSASSIQIYLNYPQNTGLSTWKDAIPKRKGILVFQPSLPVTNSWL